MRKLLILCSIVCFQHANSQTDSTSFSKPPDSTGFGTPNGKLTSSEIGPGGGTIVSDDGRFKLVFPAGSLSKPTTITIQPVTNPTLHGSGLAYSFEPSGIQFLKPVQLIFTYNDEEADDCPPELMSLASQDHTGKWTHIEYKDWDSTAKTLTGEIQHFSYYSNVYKLKLQPDNILMFVDKPNNIHVLDTKLPTTQYGFETFEHATFNTNWKNSWYVNDALGQHPTDGAITATTQDLSNTQRAMHGTYYAPKSLPRQSNPVKISLVVQYFSKKLGKKVRGTCKTRIIVVDRYDIIVRTNTYLPFGVKTKIADSARFTVSTDGEFMRISDIKNGRPYKVSGGKDGFCELILFANDQLGVIDIENRFREKSVDMKKSPPEITISFFERELPFLKYQWKCRGASPTKIEQAYSKAYPYRIKFKANGEVQMFDETQGQDEFHIEIRPHR